MRRFTSLVIALSCCSESPVDASIADAADVVASEPLDSSDDDGPEDTPDPGDVAVADAPSDVEADVEAPPGKTVELRIDGGFDLPDRVTRVLALPDGGYAAVLEVSRDARRVAVIRFDDGDHRLWTHVSNEATADEAVIDAAPVGASVAVLYTQSGARLRVLTPEGTVHADVAITTPALPTHLGASSDGRLVVLSASRGAGEYASGAFVSLDGAVLGQVPIHYRLRDLKGVRIDRDRIAFVGLRDAGLQTLNGALIWKRAVDGESDGPSGGTEAVAIGPADQIAAGIFDIYGDGEWPPDEGFHRVRAWDAENTTLDAQLAESFEHDPGVALAFGPAAEVAGIATSDTRRATFVATRYGTEKLAGWSYGREFDRGTSLAFLTDGSLVLGGSTGHETPTDASDGLLIHVRALDSPPTIDSVERVVLATDAPPPGTCNGPPACDGCPAICGLELLPASPGAPTQQRLVTSTDVDTGATALRLDDETTALDGWYYGTRWIGGPGAASGDIGVGGGSAVVAFGDDGSPAEVLCDTFKYGRTYEPLGRRLVLMAWWNGEVGWMYQVFLPEGPVNAPGVPVGVDGERVLALSEGSLVLTDYATTPPTVVATREAPPSTGVYFGHPTTHDGIALGWTGLGIDMRSPTLSLYSADQSAPCHVQLTPLPSEAALVAFRLGMSPPRRVATGESVACERTALEDGGFAVDPNSSRIATLAESRVAVGVPGAASVRTEQWYPGPYQLAWVDGAVVVRWTSYPAKFTWLDPATATPKGAEVAVMDLLGETTVGGGVVWSVGRLDEATGSQPLYRIAPSGAVAIPMPGIAGIAGVREPGGPALYVSGHDGTIRALSADGFVIASTTLDSPLRGPLAAGPAGLVGRDHRGRVVWLSPDLLTVARTADCTGFVPSDILGPSPAGLRVVGVEGPPGGAAGAGPSTLRVVDLTMKDGILTLVTVLQHTVTGLPDVVVDKDDGAIWYGEREWRRIGLPL